MWIGKVIQKYNGDILTYQTDIWKEVEHFDSKLFKEHVIPEDINLEDYVDSSITSKHTDHESSEIRKFNWYWSFQHPEEYEKIQILRVWWVQFWMILIWKCVARSINYGFK